MIADGKSANSTTLRAQKLRVALRQTLASEFIQETTHFSQISPGALASPMSLDRSAQRRIFF